MIWIAMNRDARKNVDYDSFSKTFSKSRINLMWKEIEYYYDFLWEWKFDILDIWCWNWRLIEVISEKINNYLWVDLSEWLISEARKLHRNYDFVNLSMLDIDKLPNKKYDAVFFIASYHHLTSTEDRLLVLNKTRDYLKDNWFIFMTNWALNSSFNNTKYKKSIINWSINEFWSLDYDIKIGDSSRFYHCFSLEELEYISKNTWFEIIENRLFDGERNNILILKKSS